jgi:FKBP-type peptidyl-prolyl cis-trans isomerase (trigger factor)
MAKYEFKQTYNSERNKEQLDFTIPKDDFEAYVQKALKQVSSETTMPGFRKGKAPEAQILRAKYNEITEKAVNLAINEALQGVETLDPMPLEQLEVTGVTFNEQNDLLLTFSYVPVPKVELGDLTKIKVGPQESKKTTEEEVKAELQNLWFFYEKKKNPEANKDDFSEDKLTEEFFTDSEIKNDYPEIHNADDLKVFLEKYINATYEAQSRTAYENEIVEALVKDSTFEKVEPLIDRELERRVENYKARFTSIGMDADEYMSKNNLDPEELKKDWKEQAEKDVKLELVLQKYGQEEKIEPTPEEIEQNIQGFDDATKKAYANNPEGLKSLVRYYFINQKAYNDIVEKIRSNSEKKKEAKKEKK